MTKSQNKNLHKAKHEKNDEFYTQLADIKNELRHYKLHCNKKMEILDKYGKETGKYTYNAKGMLYKVFNPEIDIVTAFKDCETGQLY